MHPKGWHIRSGVRNGVDAHAGKVEFPLKPELAVLLHLQILFRVRRRVLVWRKGPSLSPARCHHKVGLCAFLEARCVALPVLQLPKGAQGQEAAVVLPPGPRLGSQRDRVHARVAIPVDDVLRWHPGPCKPKVPFRFPLAYEADDACRNLPDEPVRRRCFPSLAPLWAYPPFRHVLYDCCPFSNLDPKPNVCVRQGSALLLQGVFSLAQALRQ